MKNSNKTGYFQALRLMMNGFSKEDNNEFKTFVLFNDEEFCKEVEKPKKFSLGIWAYLPIVYFFSALMVLFMLILLSLFDKKNFSRRIKSIPLHPFPHLLEMKSMLPHFFSISLLLISLSGLLNVWFISSILLQRFSVPELRIHKLCIHMMFIFGIFSNLIYIFFGFSPELLSIESIKISRVKVSLSLVIFILFIFFNMLFCSLMIYSLQLIQRKVFSDKSLIRNIKIKRILAYLCILIMIVYLIAIPLFSLSFQKINKYRYLKNKHFIRMLKYITIIIPYLLFMINAFINLSYYFDLIFFYQVMNFVLEEEYFINTEEKDCIDNI